MKRRIIVCCSLIVGLALLEAHAADVLKAHAVVSDQPLHSGRIDPKLFGNFIELLDDVVPGMWAELLNDRSFEGVIPAATWCYYDGSPDICDRQWDTNATWSIETKNAFNGSRCARVSAGPQPASLSQTGLSIKKGMTYAFSGHFRAQPGIRAKVLLKTRLPSGDWMELAAADLPAISTGWKEVSLTLRSRGETDQAVFELRAHGSGNLWADTLSLMPTDNQAGWRRDIVDAIREVRPGIIRWGGSTIDPGRYLWKNGIGDRDRRTPWRNLIWGRIDPNDVGIDEFCQFCELAGAEPLVCVSFADGAGSAAELVEYCNGAADTPWGARRAANGHPAPYRIKYWQVGNEIDGNNRAYLEQIATFISGMKRADPAISILTSFPSQALLERVGKDIAMVCPHHYTTDLAACDHEFAALAQMMEQIPGCSHIQIGVTEWNIDAGSWGLGRGRQATLGAALANARYLHVLMRHSDVVRLACRSNLANSYCGAIIETGMGGTGVLKRPSYFVMQLYARHAKPIPLRLEQTGESVDLFACATADKTAAVLFAINSKPQPVGLSFAFNGLRTDALRAEALCDTRNAGQADVENHWAVPDRVNIRPLRLEQGTLVLPPLSVTAIEGGLR